MSITKPLVTPVWASTATDNVTPTDAFIAAGWPLSTTPPSRQRFNWLLNYLYNGVRYFSRRGIADYDAAETYMTNDRTMGPDGLTYVSLVDGNIANTPASSPTEWARWGGGGFAGLKTSIAWLPSGASSNVLTTTFIASCNGYVNVRSTATTGNNQTVAITNVASINGNNGPQDSVNNSSVVQQSLAVTAGTTVTVTGTLSVTAGTAIGISHWLDYQFIPS